MGTARNKRSHGLAYLAKSARVRRKRIRRLVLMALLSGTRFAQAQFDGATSSTRLDLREVVRESSSQREAQKNWQGSATFESLQYPTLLAGQENLSQNNMMEAALKGESASETWPRLSASFDAAAGRSLNLNYSYFSVMEASAAWTSANSVYSLRIGRHVENWNAIDEDWNLGLWQPTFAMDALRIEQQGLTGLFAKGEGDRVQALVFYSPLFVPSTTPEIADREGEITSESRWFRSLPTTSQIMGRPTQLFFRLEIPEVRSLVSQSAWGGQIRVGDKQSGPWARVSYADKAMNSLFFKYDASLRTREASRSRAEIELRPLAHRHEVYGADMGFRYSTGEVVASYVHENPRLASVHNEPNREGLMTDFIQQMPSSIRAAMLRWDQELHLPGTLVPLYGRISYLRAENDQTRDYDQAGVEQSALLPYRLFYTHALSMEGRLPLSARWTGKLKYLREFDQQGSVWNAELEYRSRSNWAVVLGGDVLGPDDASDSNNDTRFLNYYRQNDRIYGGLSYVF